MAKVGVLEVEVRPDLGGFQSQVNSAISSIGGAARAVGGQLAKDLGNIGASIASAAAIGGTALATIGIKTLAGLETATLQFQTLMGSAEEAQKHVASLFEIAKRTPFETGPIIEASRKLEVFGGAALDTSENILRMGDAAAATGAPIEDVAFWVGRLFSQLQGGQKFGEAAMRLQELAVLSPEVRTEMERLQEAGADADDIFKVFTDHLDQFAGAMKLQENTLQGLTSTLSDMTKLSLGEIFAPVFGPLKDFLGVLRDFGNTPEFDRFILNAQAFVGTIARPLIDSIGGLSAALDSITKTDVDQWFDRVAGTTGTLVGTAKELYDTFKPLAPVIAGVAVALASTYASSIPLVGLLFPQISALSGALIGFALGIDKNREALKRFGAAIGGAGLDALPKLKESIQEISDALSETFAGALDALTPALEYVVSDLIPTLADVLGDVAGPLGEVITAIADFAGGLIVEIGPTLEAVAQGVGAILSAGLSLLADAIGVLADNADILAPAIAGLAAAFLTLKISNLFQEIGGLSGAFETLYLKVLLAKDALAAGTFGQAIGNIQASASGAATAVGVGAGGLGAAIGGLGIAAVAAVGVGLLVASFRRSKQEAQESADRIRTLTQLIEEHGESSKTAAIWVNDLAEAGGTGMEKQAQALLEMGINAEVLGDAIAGQPAAIDEVTAAIERQADAQFGTEEELLKAIERGNEGAAAKLATRDQFIADQQDAVEQLGDEYETSADKAGTFQTAQDRLKEVTKTYTEDVEGLRNALEMLQNHTSNLVDAENRHAQARLSTSQALQKNHDLMDLNNEDSLASREAVAAEAQAIIDRTEALVRGGTPQEDAIAMGKAWSQQLYDNMIQLGVTDEQARNYLTSLGLMDDYDAITTAVQLTGTELAQLRAQIIMDQLDDIDNTEAEADILAALQRGDIDEAERLLAELNNTTAEPKIIPKIIYTDQFLAGSHNIARGLGPGGQAAGVPMMGPEAPTAGLRAGTTAATAAVFRPAVLSPRFLGGVAAGALVIPQVENKIFVGTQQITDIVREEATVIARDRSMAFIGASA